MVQLSTPTLTVSDIIGLHFVTDDTMTVSDLHESTIG